MTALDEGLAWVDRMTSGSATSADAAALAQWRNQSAANAMALRQAILLRQTCRVVGEARLPRSVSVNRPRMARRAMLGAGALVFAGAAAWAAVEPPLGLWPSLAEAGSDYRTGKGEQQQLALQDGVLLRMNTLTSLSKADTPQGAGVRLVDGEIAVTLPADGSRPFAVHVKDVTVSTRRGTFNVRLDSPLVIVTAVSGEAMIAIAGRELVLPAGHQVSVVDGELQPLSAVDTALVLAWQQDLLLLRDATLATAVREINRYRPGLIVIGNSHLASRQINAILRLNDLSESVDLICRLTGAHATAFGKYLILT